MPLDGALRGRLVDELVPALDRFLEATARDRKRRASTPLERRLERAIAKAFRTQGTLFVRRFRTLRSAPTNEALREALREADWIPYFASAVTDTLSLFSEPLTELALAAIEAGFRSAIVDVGVAIAFDQSNPEFVDYLAKVGVERVAGINDTTRAELRTLISDASARGDSYSAIARRISARYERFAVGVPQQHLRSRAELVAVTEIGDAYEFGTLSAAADLASGGIPMEKSWLTVGDARVSAGCRENERAGWIELDKAFPSGHDRPLRFPGCRCALLTQRRPDRRV